MKTTPLKAAAGTSIKSRQLKTAGRPALRQAEEHAGNAMPCARDSGRMMHRTKLQGEEAIN